MYTVNYFYNKFLDKIDKEGSDILSLPQVMELLETQTNSFIDGVVKYIENTQQIRDALLPLHKSYKLSLSQNPLDINELIATLPSDYRNLETVMVVGPKVRRTTIRRKGEFDVNELNPNKRATDVYPVVLLYNDIISVHGSTNFTEVKGFYIAKPIFGDIENNLKTEIVVNLPDQSVEKIMDLMTTSFHSRNEDRRYQLSFNQEQNFGKKQ